MSAIHVELLQRAREIIAQGRENYICLALDTAANDMGEDYAKPWASYWKYSDELEKFICAPMEEALKCQQPDLESWLLHIGIDEALLTEDNMDAYRLRYIDHLIEEWRDAP